MKKFEELYRLREDDDVLVKENVIHADLDRRMDAVEQIAQAFREGNRADVDAILKSLSETFSRLAGQTQDLLDQTADNLSADAVVETTRIFLTEDRRSAILADALAAAIASIVADCPRSLTAVNTAVNSALTKISALTAEAPTDANNFAKVATKLSSLDASVANNATAITKRLIYDGAQSLSESQKAQVQDNISAVAQGSGVGQSPGKVKIGKDATTGGLKATIDSVDIGKIWSDSLITSNFSSNGYVKLPNGLIIQWGTPVGQTAWTYPTAFPNAVLCLVGTIRNNNQGVGGNIQSVNFYSTTLTSTAVSVRAANSSGTSGPTSDTYCLAIGY